MAAGHPDWTTFVTSTLRKYRSKLIENLMGQNALFWQLKQRGFVSEEKGGRSIVQPLMYGLNTTVGSYAGWDLLDVTPQEGITAAEYQWKYFAGSVVMSGIEEFENSGKEALFSLLEAKIRQLEISMKLELNQQLYADGTANDGKDLTGLALAVQDGAAWSTYGGIDSNDALNDWWRNQYFDFDTVYGASSTFGEAVTGTSTTKGISALRKMFTLCQRVGTKPTLIVTTSDIYNAYEGEIEGDKLRVTDRSLADAGFMNQTYKGVPMIFDEDMDSEGILFLNSEYLKMVIGKGRNFSNSDFMKAPQQDGKHSFVFFAGNLVMSKRDVHGRITGVSV